MMVSLWELKSKNFPNEHFRRENIYVFWNVEEYPLPRGEEDVVDNARKTINNIISAFRQLGSVGQIGVIAFTKNPDEGRLLMDCGAMSWKTTDVGDLRNKMERYVVSFPRTEAGRIEPNEYGIEERSILVVVAKLGTQDSLEFDRVLTSLKERGQQIVLLEPQGDYFEFPTMSSVFVCGKFLGGDSLTEVPKYADEKYGRQDFNHGDDPVVRAHPHHCFFQDRVWFDSDSDSNT